MENLNNRKIMDVLNGKSFKEPPIWLMRQAGRYLPEYREVRKQAGSFLAVCYNPELAIEVSIQPIKRFGFDASILFSDILVIPDALGRSVKFVEGEGPRLDPISVDEIEQLVSRYECEEALAHLKPVLETVYGLRGELPRETTLLGFCGAPWTVATYMIAGRGTPDQAPARLFSYANPEAFEKLLNLLSDVSADYLIAQLRAGADAVQIFDSWAGVLGEQDFDRWCVAPVKRLVAKVRAEIPDAKIIGFPKGAAGFYKDYREKTGVDALGLDWTISNQFGRDLQKDGAVQGNLDPMRVVAGGRALDQGVDQVLESFSDGPHIFNLGHGITPQAPISHVEQLLRRVRG